MDSQTTQMVKAQRLKKTKVNQSTSALTLRSKVGNANAASVAKAGKANSNALSLRPVPMVLHKVTAKNQSGRAKCGCFQA
jgi:hypothetical protein